MWKKLSTSSRSREIPTAFTLIELLVIVTIIALLVSALLSYLPSQRTEARDRKRLAEIDGLRKAVELYYTDYGEYPRQDSDWCCIEAEVPAAEVCDNFASVMKDYLPVITGDPLYPTEFEPGKKHCYYYKTENLGQEYKAYVRLEDGTDYEVFSIEGRDIPLP